MSPRAIALVTGATGFVGSSLIPVLEADGWRVRAAARDVVRARVDRPAADWVHLDVDDPASLGPALVGAEVAYYLVHSLKGGQLGYQQREIAAAGRFARAARAAGVGRVVYLGGLAPAGKPSRHLRGRLGVGKALRADGPPCLELRASMIVGAGSDSFRMLRDLAARLPAMILPSWLENRTEPIGIDDVVAALAAAARLELSSSAIYDLAGPEVLRCREILMRVAAALGNVPPALGVPLLTPRLSSWWIRFVTGVDTALARELIDGLTSDLLATHHGYRELAGLGPPVPLDEAIHRALDLRPAGGGPAEAWERAVGRLLRAT